MSKDSRKTIVYSALEVANICGVVNQTAINWIRNGYLKAFSTPGGQYRVYQDDLIDFMNKRHMRIPSDLIGESEPSDGKCILVVDDDRGLNSVIAKFFEKRFPEIEIIQAFDGFEAGAQLVAKKPDIVLLDLNLPGVDGFKLCSQINEDDKFGNRSCLLLHLSTTTALRKMLKRKVLQNSLENH